MWLSIFEHKVSLCIKLLACQASWCCCKACCSYKVLLKALIVNIFRIRHSETITLIHYALINLVFIKPVSTELMLFVIDITRPSVILRSMHKISSVISRCLIWMNNHCSQWLTWSVRVFTIIIILIIFIFMITIWRKLWVTTTFVSLDVITAIWTKWTTLDQGWVRVSWLEYVLSHEIRILSLVVLSNLIRLEEDFLL